MSESIYTDAAKRAYKDAGNRYEAALFNIERNIKYASSIHQLAFHKAVRAALDYLKKSGEL